MSRITSSHTLFIGSLWRAYWPIYQNSLLLDPVIQFPGTNNLWAYYEDTV